MAALIEGHYKGKIDIIKKGAFVLEKNIILPKYLSRGDYYADLFLHHPMYEYQLKAPHCIDIRADGSQADYGRPIRCKYSGFEGLETI
jgi:lipopolysaccharide transport system ATP-binding protein